MNKSAKRQQAKVAIALLMEVVEEVLSESAKKGEGGLTAVKVAERAGIPTLGNRGQLSRYVLDRLRKENIATDDQPGHGAGSWRLVD